MWANWGLKYLRGSRALDNIEAVKLLDLKFNSNRINKFHRFENNIVLTDEEERIVEIEEEKEFAKALKEDPALRVNIMGTFQTINFTNENDIVRGLENLVNENFYLLFQQFPKNRSILIPDNRRFFTRQIKKDETYVAGVSGIPDALLILFTKSFKDPLQINLIEYECYGENKTRSSAKSDYLNTHIIPQLMRFAATFSIITEQYTRDNTIKVWTDKILSYINKDPELEKKLSQWVKELNPSIRERAIDHEVAKLLENAFKSNLRVMLIIDELTSEQKLTIKNVINSFKLGGDKTINFEGYVVKLIQKINIRDKEAEYALTVQ